MWIVITANSVTKDIVTYVAGVVNLFVSGVKYIKAIGQLLTLVILMKYYIG